MHTPCYEATASVSPLGRSPRVSSMTLTPGLLVYFVPSSTLSSLPPLSPGLPAAE